MKERYLAVVHHDPGSAYGVTFPDVPGCFAAADEAKDIVRNAISALDDFFEDTDEAFAASTIEEILPTVSEDLAEGAFLIQVPLIRRNTKTVRANISLERGLLDALDAFADQLDLNRSAFIAQAVRNEITQRSA